MSVEQQRAVLVKARGQLQELLDDGGPHLTLEERALLHRKIAESYDLERQLDAIVTWTLAAVEAFEAPELLRAFEAGLEAGLDAGP